MKIKLNFFLSLGIFLFYVIFGSVFSVFADSTNPLRDRNKINYVSSTALLTKSFNSNADQSGARSFGSVFAADPITGIGIRTSGSVGSVSLLGAFGSGSGSLGSTRVVGLNGSASTSFDSFGVSPFLSESVISPAASISYSSGWAFGSGAALGGLQSGFNSLASTLLIAPTEFGVGSFGSLIGFDSLGSVGSSKKLPQLLQVLGGFPAAINKSPEGFLNTSFDMLTLAGGSKISPINNSLGSLAGIDMEGASVQSIIAPSMSTDYLGGFSLRLFSSFASEFFSSSKIGLLK